MAPGVDKKLCEWQGFSASGITVGLEGAKVLAVELKRNVDVQKLDLSCMSDVGRSWGVAALAAPPPQGRPCRVHTLFKELAPRRPC